MRFNTALVVMGAAILAALSLAVPAGALASGASPAPVVDALLSTINAGDVEESVEFFADDAVVIQPRIGGLPQIYVGRDQVRWWLRNLAAQHAQFNSPAAGEILDGRVWWLSAFGIDAFRHLGISSITVETDVVLDADQRIRSLRTVLTPEAARSLQQAPGAVSSEPAEWPLNDVVLDSAVLLSLGFGAGAAAALVVWPRRRRLTPRID